MQAPDARRGVSSGDQMSDARSHLVIARDAISTASVLENLADGLGNRLLECGQRERVARSVFLQLLSFS